MKAIRFLLFPFAVLYDGVTSVRNVFYNKGVFKSTRFEIPVIAVGNLSVGGTGKTPQIEYLIRLLQDNYKIAVLSRGYKRKTEGFILLNNQHSAEDVGDEPLQFYEKFPKVSIAVDANRTNGIQQLQKRINPDIVLLDDAYQHRKVEAGFYVLLTKYDDLYASDFMLPTGNLRESRRGAKRANVIVVTKCPESLSEAEQKKIIQKLKPEVNQPVFFSTINYQEETKGSQQVSIDILKDYEILLITGIANPKPLLSFLKNQECKFEHLEFPDHHNFSSQEIQKIQSQFEGLSSNKKILLTTEKDYMRLSDKISDLSYVEIESKFISGKESFNQQIASVVSTKKV